MGYYAGRKFYGSWRQTAGAAPKVMAARFAGTCKTCGKGFASGDSILWSRSTGATHATADLCAAAAPAAPAAPTLDLSSVVAFLGVAVASGLKRPKARFLGPDGKAEMTLQLAGPTSRTPGAIFVKLGGWYTASVLPDGSTRGKMTPELASLLLAIAADPVTAAKTYGGMTCSCSFCGLALTDQGSIDAGYGPVCARKWGLPHHSIGAPVLTAVGSHAATPSAAPAPTYTVSPTLAAHFSA